VSQPARRLRAATRGSPLARWQTDHVATLLRAVAPDLEVEVVVVSTVGDRRQDVPIHEMGGKGVFAKEVQLAVLDGRADIAVHSAKDLPARTPIGLVLGAVPPRGDVRDALVGARLAELAEGALVATGSVRRRVQLAALRPDLRFAELRGNIATRLAAASGFDAIVMAAAALERLGERPPVVELLEPSVMLPQAGQGALAVECRADDAATRALLSAIEDVAARRAVDAERGFLVGLGGDCDLPAGALASAAAAGPVEVEGVLADDDGGRVRRATLVGDDPQATGVALAKVLAGS
jgi:hydroxymethylbilane synthase